MIVDYTDEQVLLKDSVKRLFASAAQSKDSSEQRWARYLESGLLAMPFSEDFGGYGGGAFETMILMEEAGRVQVRDGYLPIIVVAGEVLRNAGTERAAAIGSALAAGEATACLVAGDFAGRFDIAELNVSATTVGDGWVLKGNGVCTLADTPSNLIVATRAEDNSTLLFCVEANDPGISASARQTWDGSGRCNYTLDNVWVGKDDLISGRDDAAALIQRAVDAGTAAVCAEAAGAMAAALDLTVGYLKTRKQFKVPLSSFQTLQHRAVDMLVCVEQSRSAAMAAAAACVHDEGSVRRRNVARAKVLINRSARFVGENAVQLHGAIGLTEEYNLGGYFKRLTAIQTLFGNDQHHLNYLAAD